MIELNPHGIYSAAEVAELLDWSERTVRRAARRLGKKRGAMFSAAEIREIVGVRA